MRMEYHTSDASISCKKNKIQVRRTLSGTVLYLGRFIVCFCYTQGDKAYWTKCRKNSTILPCAVHPVKRIMQRARKIFPSRQTIIAARMPPPSSNRHFRNTTGQGERLLLEKVSETSNPAHDLRHDFLSTEK